MAISSDYRSIGLRGEYYSRRLFGRIDALPQLEDVDEAACQTLYVDAWRCIALTLLDRVRT